MIGRVQDVMVGSIVIGAADKAAASAKQPEMKEKATDAPKVEMSEAERLQDEWNANADAAFRAEEKEPETEKLDEKSVSLITKELNELMEKINCDLAFTYHKEVDVMSVSMINKKTDEVIKELPPEEMIENIKKAREWIGAFLDKNA